MNGCNIVPGIFADKSFIDISISQPFIKIYFNRQINGKVGKTVTFADFWIPVFVSKQITDIHLSGIFCTFKQDIQTINYSDVLRMQKTKTKDKNYNEKFFQPEETV